MNTDRLDHLRRICADAGLDGFLISSSSNIFYLSGFNRFLVEHDGFFLVTKNHSYLITSPLYTQAVKKFTPDLQVLETSPDMWSAQMIKKIVVEEHLTSLGFEERDLRVAEFFDLQEEKITLKSVSLRPLRMQKSLDEIKAIQKACDITDQTFSHVLSFIKEGVTELQLAGKMNEFLRSNNAEIGFPSIIAFGRHSAVPHHMTSDETLTKNSFVLFDFGVRVNNYLSDMSRTIFFGNPTNQQVKLYETVKKSQEKAVEYISEKLTGVTPEIFVKDIDAVARETIEKENFPAYPHALGHGIGLEVHEAPTLSKYSPEKLLANTVFTIEPGIYLPELGGVRIEDMYVLQDNKLIELTSSPKELIVI